MIPPFYKCHKCEVTGVKLWRDYGCSCVELTCANCLKEKPDLKDSDQVGGCCPAVPTLDEPRNGWWGYTGVPPEGVAWWKALPLYLEGSWEDKDGSYEWVSRKTWHDLINTVELARIDNWRNGGMALIFRKFT